MILVVDASVVLKWFVNEDHSAEAHMLVDERFDLNAPELLLAELGNILWKKRREQSITSDQLETALDLVDEQDVTYHQHDSLLKVAVSGAVETGQAVYDWMYLSLALSLSSRLVTADRRFFLAMRATRFRHNLIWVENIPNLIDHN